MGESEMKRITAYAICLGAIWGTSSMMVTANAQEKSLKDQLVGTWVYDSSTSTRADGTKTDRPNLKGMVIYTSEGRFIFINVGTDTPRIAANDRARATPEEAVAVLSKTIAYYGTYTIDEASKTVVPKIEGSTFANLIGGPEQKRVITAISADEMRFINPRTPAGDTLEFVWKRAK
jgi:Lipocalin-like domain